MNLENAILSLVRTYIERQQLVFDVIQALRSDMFVTGDQSIPVMVAVEMARKYADIPQTGIWQNDEGVWDYFFHGSGCRLTHQITGEVIDWDAPDTEIFDSWKFMYWIKWAVEVNPKHLTDEVECLNRAISRSGELETVVNHILKRLTNQGVLEKVSQNRLRFK